MAKSWTADVGKRDRDALLLALHSMIESDISALGDYPSSVDRTTMLMLKRRVARCRSIQRRLYDEAAKP